MNKYKVEFNLKAQQKGKPKYDFIFGQTENSALEDAGLSREQIVGIYLLDTEKVDVPVSSSVFPTITAESQGVSVDTKTESVVDPVSEPTEPPSVQDEPTSVGNELSTEEASTVTPELSANDDLAYSGSSEFN